MWGSAIFILIAICLFVVYYAQGMGLPSHARFFKIKIGLWVFRSLLTVFAVLMALSFKAQAHAEFAQFFAMFALANSMALPYKRNPIPKTSNDYGVIEGMKSKIGFSIGSALFLLIVSFIAVKVSGFIGFETYWYSLVIFFGAIGLHVNESGLTEIYADMKLSKIASLDILRRKRILLPACGAYYIGCALIGYILFSSVALEFNNYTGWSGLLIGAVLGGLFELDL